MSDSFFSLEKIKTNSQCRNVEKEPIVWNLLKACNRKKKRIFLLVFKGIIAYIQVAVAPKRVWGPSNLISNFNFTKFLTFASQNLTSHKINHSSLRMQECRFEIDSGCDKG